MNPNSSQNSQSLTGSEIDQQYEKQSNKRVRSKLFLLVPYNCAIMWALSKYVRNLPRLSKKYFPLFAKPSPVNMVIMSTVHSIAFCGIYFGGNLAVLGINPFKIYSEMQKNKEEEELLMANYSMSTDGRIKQVSQELTPKAASMRDSFIMSGFKSMGLKPSTIAMIEEDLRRQQSPSLRKNQLQQQNQQSQEQSVIQAQVQTENQQESTQKE